MLDAIKTLRAQIADAELRRKSGSPDRIRITDLIQPGFMFLAPYEEDGSIPSPDRTVTDDGLHEILVHPDDWRQVVSAAAPPAGGRTTHIFGIPVKDDTRD